MEQLRNFVELVAEMRQTQKDYFASRSLVVLDKARKLERSVDRHIDYLRSVLSSSKNKQLTFSFYDNEEKAVQ